MAHTVIADSFTVLIDPDATPRQLAGGFGTADGPVWHPAARHLLFSDMLNDVRRTWSPETGITEIARPTFKGNGMTLDRDLNLLVCEHASNAVVRIDPAGRRTVLCAQYQGRALNSPNDLVVTADGAIYFTDPTYGRMPGAGIPRPTHLGFQGVYRIDPDHTPGDSPRLVTPPRTFKQPQGICLVPGAQEIWISDSELCTVRQFRIDSDGDLVDARLVASGVRDAQLAGTPDALKADSAGNLFVTAPGGVWVYDPDGTLIGKILMPVPVQNLHWGGAGWGTLYLCGRSAIFALETKTRGQPEPFMRNAPSEAPTPTPSGAPDVPDAPDASGIDAADPAPAPPPPDPATPPQAGEEPGGFAANRPRKLGRSLLKKDQPGSGTDTGATASPPRVPVREPDPAGQKATGQTTAPEATSPTTASPDAGSAPDTAKAPQREPRAAQPPANGAATRRPVAPSGPSRADAPPVPDSDQAAERDETPAAKPADGTLGIHPLAEPLTARRCALVLVDLQNDMISPGGAFGDTGAPDHAAAQRLLPTVVDLIARARATGVQVIHAWTVHEPGHPHLAQHAAMMQGVKGLNALVRGTWGAAPARGVEPRPGDLVVEKLTLSAWENTRLETFVRHSGRDTLIVCGAWTNTGVESLVRTGADRGFRMIVPEDCCASMDADWHRASINYALQACAAVTSANQVIRALE